MSDERPKLKVPLEPFDVIAEIITLSLLVLLIIYTFMSYQDMPETVPMHFNAQGEVDRFGSKNTIWLLPGIGVLIYVCFSILNRFPHMHNYNINITEENAMKNYRLSTRVLRFTLLFIMLLFIYIEYAIVSMVTDNSNVFGSWFVPTLIVVSLIIPVFIYIKSKKNEQIMKKSLVLLFLLNVSFLFSQNTIVSEEILIMNDSIKLPGTLTFDSSLYTQPLIIFVHGSGNVDRNGNQMGLPANASYIQQLSDSLTHKGIAFYRYDKRTSTLANMKYLMQEIKFDDFVEDLRLAIDNFKNDERFSSITLLGHSQGSMVAMLASKSDVDKYISLAGPSQSIDTTILNQFKNLYPDLVEPATRYFQELRDTGTIKEVKEPVLQQIFPKQNQAFFASWIKYDPVEELKKVTIPFLILNGTKDLQVTVADAKNLHASQPTSKLVIIENMNHILKNIEKDEDNLASYSTPDFPLSKELLTVIETFVKQ